MQEYGFQTSCRRVNEKKPFFNLVLVTEMFHKTIYVITVRYVIISDEIIEQGLYVCSEN